MQGQPKGQSPSSCNEIFGQCDEIALNLIVLDLCMDELDYGWLYMAFLSSPYDGYELDDQKASGRSTKSYQRTMHMFICSVNIKYISNMLYRNRKVYLSLEADIGDLNK